VTINFCPLLKQGQSLDLSAQHLTAKCGHYNIRKQKEGKKKMKMFGKVNIPQDAFIKVLKSGD
jgi:hypothetical protein